LPLFVLPFLLISSDLQFGQCRVCFIISLSPPFFLFSSVLYQNALPIKDIQRILNT
jgi:hypothetical protein